MLCCTRCCVNNASRSRRDVAAGKHNSVGHVRDTADVRSRRALSTSSPHTATRARTIRRRWRGGTTRHPQCPTPSDATTAFLTASAARRHARDCTRDYTHHTHLLIGARCEQQEEHQRRQQQRGQTRRDDGGHGAENRTRRPLSKTKPVVAATYVLPVREHNSLCSREQTTVVQCPVVTVRQVA